MNDGNYMIAIPAAIIAGIFLAATGLFQQQEASQQSERKSLSLGLLVDLAHSKVWLIGLLFGFFSYGFQALALAFGPLALVQPLVLSELIIAVPISFYRRHTTMGVREWGSVATVAVGLAAAIVAASPGGGDPLPPLPSWLYAIAAVMVISLVAVLAGRVAAPTARASLFAFAAASMLALQSAFLAATTALFQDDIVSIFTHWQSYALVPSTAIGVLLMQSAYQAGPLAASMPVVDAAEPTVAVAIGVALFGEHISTGSVNLGVAGAGFVLFIAGIIALDTSPRTQRLQRIEQGEREGGDEDAAVTASA